MTREIPINLSGGEYRVYIGRGVLAGVGAMIREALRAPAQRVFVAVDSNIPGRLLDSTCASLEAAGFAPRCWSVSACETKKTMSTLEAILAAMARAGIDRRDPVLALGGGIVGDTAGFAGAIYRRGVPVVQCPTTLLAMVDASVGGKTGVNLDAHDDADLKKNFVGAFHQPILVIADVSALDSLPDRHLRSGLAECVKHGLLGAFAGDPSLLDWTQSHRAEILKRCPEVLVELVARNVGVKARIVATDEREEAEDSHGGRALLNLGHTFAHAIETIPGLCPESVAADAPLHHGEAVAVGLVAAARCSAMLHLCDPALPSRLINLLRGIGLPVRLDGLPPTDEIIARMGHDKKVLGGKLRVVLPTDLGTARVVSDPPIEAIRSAIEGMR